MNANHPLTEPLNLNSLAFLFKQTIVYVRLVVGFEDKCIMQMGDINR